MTKYIPLAFAALWSTGFIGAKFGLPFVGPYTFLFLRFSITLCVLLLIILVLRITVPKDLKSWRDTTISGLLIHVAYLGGVFTAIHLGLSAGATAVIVGTQPILTLIVTGSARDLRSFGITSLGFLGLLLVVWEDGFSLPLAILFPAIIAALGITLGTIYQKKTLGHFPVLLIAFMQYVPTFGVFGLLVFMFEFDAPVEWTLPLVFALGWLSLVLSIGAILLLSMLYQKNSASIASNFFYAAPPLTLLQGYLFFDERVSHANLVGMLLIVASLYLITKKPKPEQKQTNAG